MDAEFFCQKLSSDQVSAKIFFYLNWSIRYGGDTPHTDIPLLSSIDILKKEIIECTRTIFSQYIYIYLGMYLLNVLVLILLRVR